MPDIHDFLRSYVDTEYQTWIIAHKDRNEARYLRALDQLDANYFALGAMNDISRPGSMDDEAFTEFAELLANKRKRRIFKVCQMADGTYLVPLGSVICPGDHPLELIRVRPIDGSLKIVSTYLTNFDGTYSWSGGEHAGDIVCPPSTS